MFRHANLVPLEPKSLDHGLKTTGQGMLTWTSYLVSLIIGLGRTIEHEHGQNWQR
jgi:hypothetical protein